jgi:dihydroorotase
MSLLELLACLTCRPAAILRGRSGLTRGWPADLVVFDHEKPWTIDPDRFKSKSKNSPLEGHMVQGRVLRTVVDGRPIFVAS